jgi:sialate O-acetylesterase
MTRAINVFRALALEALAVGSISAVLAPVAARGDVTLPNIFTDHMVLQQKQPNKVWGKAEAGESVIVQIDGQKHETKADADGHWHVTLQPMEVGEPRQLTVQGKNAVTIADVLIGEVWICSGQSNMQWSIADSNDPDLERLAAKFPQIRMINFPQVGAQEPIWTHDRRWEICTPQSVSGFSAVGYFFARQLHQTLDVPIGMINNAWGGSAAEAWVDRKILAEDARYAGMMKRWTDMEARTGELSKLASLNEEQKKELGQLEGNMGGNHRPGNIYNGVLKSHLGYGIRGAIWYQGESNAGRAYQYRDLFPLMIQSWRKEWGQGDFPFYWVQLADFTDETGEPQESNWAELREAQTMTMDKLPNTGQAVIIDIGEGKDIHPMNKLDVGRRLARWALAKQYGQSIAFHSPQYKAMEVQEKKIVLTFDHVDGGWRPFDVPQPRGFAIAGEDKKFVWADATILPDGKIEVSSAAVQKPVAVRYGWAQNPRVNMYSAAGLPLTPFRTDDWPGVTVGSE